MIKRWIAGLALRYCRQILLCQREAALISRKTLAMGRSGVMPLDKAADRVISSLDLQIIALDALMGITPGE